MALVHGVAVPAGAVQLSEVLDDEVRDGDGAGAVVLQDLVVGAVGTAAGDVGGVARVLVLDGEGVLADGAPPHVLERAGALAVDALDLVRADDDVAERAALLDLEDGVRVAALVLARALDAPVVHVHAAVEGLAGRDGVDVVQGGGAGGGRQVEPLLDVTGLGGRRDHGLGGGNGTDGQSGHNNSDRGLHLDGSRGDYLLGG